MRRTAGQGAEVANGTSALPHAGGIAAGQGSSSGPRGSRHDAAGARSGLASGGRSAVTEAAATSGIEAAVRRKARQAQAGQDRARADRRARA